MKYLTPIILLIASSHCAYLPHPTPICVLPITTGLHHGPTGPTVVQSNDHHSWGAQSQAHNHHHTSSSSNAAAAAFWFHNNNPGWSPVLPAPPPSSATFQNHASDHHQQPQHPPTAMYVAANPGAIHKAPLPGHSVNQQALNLASAPGTRY